MIWHRSLPSPHSTPLAAAANLNGGCAYVVPESDAFDALESSSRRAV